MDTAELRATAVSNVDYLLRTDPLPDGADLAAARRTGLRRGQIGAPLPELLAGFRIAEHRAACLAATSRCAVSRVAPYPVHRNGLRSQ